MCFFQTSWYFRFKAKFYSIVQAFLKQCFRALKLCRIQITSIPSFLFMSKTNTETCICTTLTLHRSSLPLVLVLGPNLYHISAVKPDSACTQKQNLPLLSGLEVLLENRNKRRSSKRGKSVVTSPAKHPIDI